MFTCILVIILIIIFMTSIILNVSILMVFARKQTLRTTSNRLEKILYLCCILTSNNILIPISGYNIFYLLRPLQCPHETKFKISNFSDELVYFSPSLTPMWEFLKLFIFSSPGLLLTCSLSIFSPAVSIYPWSSSPSSSTTMMLTRRCLMLTWFRVCCFKQFLIS